MASWHPDVCLGLSRGRLTAEAGKGFPLNTAHPQEPVPCRSWPAQRGEWVGIQGIVPQRLSPTPPCSVGSDLTPGFASCSGRRLSPLDIGWEVMGGGRPLLHGTLPPPHWKRFLPTHHLPAALCWRLSGAPLNPDTVDGPASLEYVGPCQLWSPARPHLKPQGGGKCLVRVPHARLSCEPLLCSMGPFECPAPSHRVSVTKTLLHVSQPLEM